MAVFDPTIGISLVIVGVILLAFELIHPGALLLIPGSILLVAGFLLLFLPNALLDSFIGPIAIIVVAIVAALVEIPYYRWIAPNHWPLSTTSGGLVGAEGIVIVPVVPNTLKGKVRVRSEVWSARASTEIPEGVKVRVVHGEGVSITVVPIEPSKPA